jgi:hypothetical protein
MNHEKYALHESFRISDLFGLVSKASAVLPTKLNGSLIELLSSRGFLVLHEN